MKTAPEPTDQPLILPPKQAPAQKPDTFTEVRPGLFRNNRTGQLETRIEPPPPQYVWHPVFDEQSED